jgi:calcineurin-like phosphoesterase family protein
MKKQIFFTSDWHIGHENSIKFDNRPFKNLEDMHRQLIKNYNNTVPANGICYFLGDIATHGSELTKSIIQQLNGIKILVLGNHDKKTQACYNMGFDVVLHGAVINIQNHRVTMSHCPLLGTPREDTSGMIGAKITDYWHGESRPAYSEKFSFKNENQYHLSGHIHSPNHNKSKKILIKQFDVGVPANRYRPVHINEIESWIMTTENYINIWKPIPNIDGYLINYYGQIKSFKKYKEGSFISPHKDKDGYLCVKLTINKKPYGYKVHRLVALAFLDNPDNLPQVNHKDGHKLNCAVDNLEWISNLNNQRHAWQNDFKTIKLTIAQVSEIKQMLADGVTNTEIARKYNVDQSLISNIKTGKIWNKVLTPLK